MENNYRILVVDDIEEIHGDFKKILQPKEDKSEQFLKEMNQKFFGKDTAKEKIKLPPFEIDSAYQSKEGIALVEKSIANHLPYAVAFVDVQMPPGEDGIQTISKIWNLDPEIQIVICTAYAKYNWEDLTKLFGNTDRLFILKKPFDNLEVIQLACSLTQKWSMNRDVSEKLIKLRKMEGALGEENKSNLYPELEKSLDSLKKVTADLVNLNEKLKSKKLNP
jgi:CheY-like chemotaxis protein